MASSVRKIAIAVDGSDNSEYAVEWSVQNFLRPSDTVYIIFVFPEYIDLTQDEDGLCVPTDSISPKTAESLQHANNLLSKMKETISSIGCHVEVVVESGDARGFIPVLCEKLKADTLVMGSRGLGGLKRVLMGSVSDYCAHNVNCPMVIVRPKNQ